MNKLTYKHKANRDAKAKELKAEGRLVKKSSSRNQCIHPQYIEDEDPGLRQQTGMGNPAYKTLYPVIYHVEVIS